jgi:probable rRNA maturation factor
LKPEIEILIEERKWKARRGLPAKLRTATMLALKRGGCRKRKIALTILLGSDARLEALNHLFRGTSKATNVLSFTSAGEGDAHLGDIAIAYGVTAREARASAKTFDHHAIHLAVHGVLHLLGYDHTTERQAAKMEPLEVKVLGELGIADPYADAPKSA